MKDSKTAVEIEKKYVIKYPDIDALRKMEGHYASNIVQIYLPSDDGSTHRVRRRVVGDRVTYTETKKVRIDKMSSKETEGEITEERFLELSANPKSGTHAIHKVRHAFFYLGQQFEIDVYPEWQHTAIMETELETRETNVIFPECIKILRDVTGDKRYSNAAMSREFPAEISI